MNTPISHFISAANCPLCGAYAQITWFNARLVQGSTLYNHLPKSEFGQCSHCFDFTIWKEKRMIYPFSGSAPLANADLPDDIKLDYEEARSIIELSPRGAVALLRLCIQKLCKNLGEKGENINTDIKNLVAKGLPIRMQQALDSVRVIGNNAVHPGQIDLNDNREIAYKLFAFVNIITDILITQPNQIEEFYNAEIPDSDKAAIQRRDNR